MTVKLSRKLMFAIEAVLQIAYDNQRPLHSTDLSNRQGIPRRYLDPVLQELAQDGILKGVRGRGGGYRLGREAKQITLAHVAEAVRRTETAGDVCDYPAGTMLGQEIVQPLCHDLVTSLQKRLGEITIEDLCVHAREMKIDPTETVDHFAA